MCATENQLRNTGLHATKYKYATKYKLYNTLDLAWAAVIEVPG